MSSRASLMSSVVAMVMILKNESHVTAGGSVSTPELLVGWLEDCMVAK